MSVTRMKHPEHGEMDVYVMAEVEANKKAGWEVVVPVVAAPVEQPEPRKVLSLKGGK